MFTDSISMRMKRNLWITLVFCLPFLCFSLFAQPRSSKTRQNSLVSNSKRNTEINSQMDSREVVTPAKAGVQHERNTEINSQIDSRLRENDKQATGIILSFNKWPSERMQNKISKALKKENLKLTKKFESFQSLVFSWEQIQAQKRAESICLKLSKLKHLKYCEPDSLLFPNNKSSIRKKSEKLPLDNVSSNSETEAGATACTVDCDQTPHTLSTLQKHIQRKSLPNLVNYYPQNIN